MLSLLAGVMAFSLVTACAPSSSPALQPSAPSAAEKAAMDKKAAMEAKAMAEKKAKDEKAAMEAKAMAEKKAMDEKAAMEAKAMAEKQAMEEKAAMAKLPDQLFAPHFVESNPKHGAQLAQVPGTITLNFNFTLSETSTIIVSKEGATVASAKPTLSSNKLTMAASLPANAGNGLYQVDYKACWPDNSCHIGRFAFIVAA